MNGWVRAGLAGLALLLAAASGCVVSPQPSPPNITAEGVSIGNPAADICACVRLRGAPGTVDPPEGAVVVTPLDEDVPRISEPVRDDGSFEILVTPARLPLEVRLWVRNGGARSAPLDLAVDPDFMAVRVPRALDCVEIAPELELGEVVGGETAEGAVRVHNGCDHEVSFAPSALREAGAPFEVASDLGGAIPAGEARDVVVRARPIEVGPAEATLFVRTSAPAEERRAITLFARGSD